MRPSLILHIANLPLRSLLPLYQAITSVQLGDGKTCSFWMDVWHGDEALADMFPALFSHCTNKDISVSELISSGLQQYIVFPGSLGGQR